MRIYAAPTLTRQESLPVVTATYVSPFDVGPNPNNPGNPGSPGSPGGPGPGGPGGPGGFFGG